MNRAERRAEESALRRGLAVIHAELLPGGCPRCRGAARLRWFGLGDAGDVLGWDAVNVLIEPQEFQAALADDELQVDIWACGCGGSGAVTW